MTRDNRQACPVCAGNGFLGVVPEPRRRRRMRTTAVERSGAGTNGKTLSDAAAARFMPAARPSEQKRPYWPAHWWPLDEGVDGWGKVYQLAHVLLWAYSGDRETVATILDDFAEFKSKALSREGWFRAATLVREGEIR